MSDRRLCWRYSSRRPSKRSSESPSDVKPSQSRRRTRVASSASSSTARVADRMIERVSGFGGAAALGDIGALQDVPPAAC